MKNATIIGIIALAATAANAQPLRSLADDQQAAPSLHALLMQPDPQPAKTLFVFRTPRQARTWTTTAGFALISLGGYLGGKAEMKSRYYGTTSRWDSFHQTRDAGLICTGLGAGALGASIAIGYGEKPRLLDVIWKIGTGAILYRITAEATYHWTAPAR